MVFLRHTNEISFSLCVHNEDICRIHETVSSNGNVAKDCLPNITLLVSTPFLVFQGICEIWRFYSEYWRGFMCSGMWPVRRASLRHACAPCRPLIWCLFKRTFF